jgi:hypothetical protein
MREATGFSAGVIRTNPGPELWIFDGFVRKALLPSIELGRSQTIYIRLNTKISTVFEAWLQLMTSRRQSCSINNA